LTLLRERRGVEWRRRKGRKGREMKGVKGREVEGGVDIAWPDL